MRVDLGALERLPAVDRHAVLELLHIGSHFTQVLDGGGDAVGFLHAQFAGVADVGVALGQRSGDSDDGDLIDEVGDFLGQQGGAFQRRAVELDVSDRFALGVVEDFRHVRAHAGEHLEDGGAGGVEANVLDEQAGAVHRGGGDEPESGGGDIAGDGEIAGLRHLTAGHGDGVAVGAAGDAEACEHALGMVAGGGGLDHGGGAFGKKPGEQHRAFHLGGGDRHFVGDGVQLAAVDAQRRAARLLAERLYVRAHFRKRNGDATHRAGGKRGIPEQLGGERLAGQQTREQPHAGAGVPAVDGRFRSGEFHRAPVDAELRGAVAIHFLKDIEACAERAHRLEGVHAILAGQEIGNFADPVRQAAEDGRAVGDALVARHAEFGMEGGDGCDAEGGHGWGNSTARCRGALLLR